MLNGFETTPMFSKHLFGSQIFSPQVFQHMQGQMWPQAWTAWSQGMGEVSREIVAYTKIAVEDSAATYRQMLAAKSLEEAFDIQSSYARRSAEDFADQIQKLSAIYVRLAQEMFQFPGMKMPGFAGLARPAP
jgi:hypothetical protein